MSNPVAILKEERTSPLNGCAGEAPDVERFLAGCVARHLRVDPGNLDLDAALTSYGLDSLAAIEIAHRLEQEFDLLIPFEALIEGDSIRQISARARPAAAGAAPLEDSAITIAAQTGELALSRGQQALWFLHRRAPESPAYHIAAAIRFRSRLDLEALRAAWATIVARHDSLRTTFGQTAGRPFQHVHRRMPFSLSVEDASSWNDEAVNGWLAKESNRPFDLERGPLFRICVAARSATDSIALLALHHIVSDFWSQAVLLRELAERYAAERRGRTLLREEPVQYRDFVDWQERYLTAAGAARSWTYWSGQLSGPLPELNLPADRPRPAARTWQGAQESRLFGAGVTRGLKRMSEELGVSLYTTLLAIYFVLLHRYTGQEDIVVGSPAMGRGSARWAGAVGYFVNSLPLRANPAADCSFVRFLAQVRRAALDALKHQDYPFSLLVERLQPVRDDSRSPLFDTFFVFQKPPAVEGQDLAAFALGIPGAALAFEEMDLESVALERQAAQFDWTVMAGEVGDRLGLSVKYNTGLFDRETIGRMLGHFEVLAAAVVESPDCPLALLPMITGPERERALIEWNPAAAAQPEAFCVTELFERQAEATPDAAAVAFEGGELTYAELNRRANRLAHKLIGLGVGPEVPVALFLERGMGMIVGLLAILKAGGAYVPLDPSEPDQRLAAILDQVAPPILVTESALLRRLSESAADRVCVDFTEDGGPATNPASSAVGANLAYVIFTSGSTGVPRGVSVERRQLVHYVESIGRQADFPAGARFASVSTIAADLGNTMVFPALCSGGCLHIVSHTRSLDAASFAGYCAEHAIDCLKIVPSHLDVLLRTAASKSILPRRRLLLGGEAFSWDLAARVRALEPGCTVFNHYGPTETTVGVLTHRLDGARFAPAPATVPIGKPLDHVRAYVLDRSLDPVPVGIAGELYIGGASLARGYYNQPGATAVSFIPDVFAEGSRLYRTGDLARRLADGSIEFLGRADHQIKIRGYRVELQEIEAALEQHPSVRQAIVLPRDAGSAGAILTGYLVCDPGHAPAAPELRRFLKQRLPEHMIPSGFELLDRVPLTSNGKLDRKAAPSYAREMPAEAEPEDSYDPGSPFEQALAAVWSQILSVERVGRLDSFFELGGHSLLATQMISQLQELFPSEVPLLTMFFQNPTVAGLAEAILSEEGGVDPGDATNLLASTEFSV